MQCTPELAFSSTGLFCLHFCNNRGCPNSKSTILRSDLIRERILKVQFEEILPPISKLLFEEIVWRDLSKVCELAFLSILSDDWMSLLMIPGSREPDNCPTVQFPDSAKIELSAYWIGYFWCLLKTLGIWQGLIDCISMIDAQFVPYPGYQDGIGWDYIYNFYCTYIYYKIVGKWFMTKCLMILWDYHGLLIYGCISIYWIYLHDWCLLDLSGNKLGTCHHLLSSAHFRGAGGFRGLPEPLSATWAGATQRRRRWGQIGINR